MADFPPWKFKFCPAAEKPLVDWQSLSTMSWLRAMQACPQDSEHHAEGNVFEHTKLVTESLLELPGWRQAGSTEQNILFTAALLHDVAKPISTKLDSDGKISSSKHTRIGAAYAREILWSMPEFENPPFAVREQIVKLVRFSGLPLWFMEKEDPLKAVLRAGLSVRTDLLAVLAEADIRGRFCKDQSELLERLHMFCDFCREKKCFGSAFEFQSDVSRYAYFRLGSKDPERLVYDDRGALITIMSGLPASGKDTWIAKNCPDSAVVSLDKIRRELKIDPDESQAPVIARARQEAAKYLRQGREFVWNATNISGSLRSILISWMEPYKPRLRIVYVEAQSPELLKQRNKKRKDAVPEKLIAKLLRRLEVPDLSEAHKLEFSIQGH